MMFGRYFEKKKQERLTHERLIAPPYFKFEVERLMKIAHDNSIRYPEMADEYKSVIEDLRLVREKASAIAAKHSPGIKLDGV